MGYNLDPDDPNNDLVDLNGDNQITTFDLTFMLGNFGRTVPPNTNGDLNGDGQVTTSDLTTLLGIYGTSCP